VEKRPKKNELAPTLASFTPPCFSTGESTPWEPDMCEPLPCQLPSAQRLELVEEAMAKMPTREQEPAAQDFSELDAELTEARRIAGELVRLHRDGAIRSQKDAGFYAQLLRDFGAAYTGPVSSVPQDASGPYVPTAIQLVRVPRGLTREERQRSLQKDLDDMAA
jgi:hypothetical protein